MSVEPHSIPAWLSTVLLAEDDTEESVMGSDWHQEAIFEAHGTLLSYAEERAAGGTRLRVGQRADPLVPHRDRIGSTKPSLPGPAEERQTAGGPLWYVSSQVTVIVPLPRRAKPWQPKPDIFVVAGTAPLHRTSYDTRHEGRMPQFVLEVASESTWRDDVEEKRDLYEVVGVQEYLVFDPTGGFFAERVRAWHRTEQGWQSWTATLRPDGQPVWESAVLGLALRVEAALLRFDHPVLGPLPVRRELLARWHAAQQALEAAERERDQERQARATAERDRDQERQTRAAAERDRDQERQARAAAERDQERQARAAADQRARAAEQALAALREEVRRRSSGPEADRD